MYKKHEQLYCKVSEQDTGSGKTANVCSKSVTIDAVIYCYGYHLIIFKEGEFSDWQ